MEQKKIPANDLTNKELTPKSDQQGINTQNIS